MKKIVQISRLMLLSSLLFVACKKSYTSGTTTTTPTPTVVTTGNWTISSYIQKTENKTGNYTGITFAFSSDGKLTAAGTKSATGTWATTPSSPGYYGGPATQGTFSINLGTATPFDALNKAWVIIDQTATTIKLDNKEPLEDEHLVLSQL